MANWINFVYSHASAKQGVVTKQTVDSDNLVLPIVALNTMCRKGQQQPKRNEASNIRHVYDNPKATHGASINISKYSGVVAMSASRYSTMNSNHTVRVFRRTKNLISAWEEIADRLQFFIFFRHAYDVDKVSAHQWYTGVPLVCTYLAHTSWILSYVINSMCDCTFHPICVSTSHRHEPPNYDGTYSTPHF